MHQYDLSPLYRTAVGFDRLAALLDGAYRQAEHSPGYPPYDIEKVSEEKYRISIAAAGFDAADLEIISEEGTLTVRGKVAQDNSEMPGKFLHKGIARRAFERRFQLAEHIRVTGADLVNGLLSIDLVREVPEAAKPRRIEISQGAEQAKISKAA